jgi:flagellar FliL protein
MAEIPTLDAAPQDAAAAPARKRSWLLLAVISAVSVSAAAGGGWFFLGRGKPQNGKEAHAPASVPAGPALYAALDPPFVTNFEADQIVRFLQVTVQVMSHDPATMELIKANDPAIRNDLLLLFGNQKYADLSSRSGKEQLRAQALECVRHIVAAVGGTPQRVEALYFTSFVMQ